MSYPVESLAEFMRRAEIRTTSDSRSEGIQEKPSERPADPFYRECLAACAETNN